MLVGRSRQQRELDAVLDRARGERSAALVLRGEPGVGKTALLDYACDHADGMRVLRCAGIEAEHELPFAGMHQLMRPCLDLIDQLPGPQAAALSGAFGLSFDGTPDRFLVALGVLSLLAEAGEQQPLLCVVDDAQWLDEPSIEALGFAVRRLEAERVAVVITIREGDPRAFELPGVPEVHLDGLDEDDARELLGQRLDAGAAPEVVDRLLADARGNPLALLELPAGLSPDQLAGAEPILGPPPVRPAVEGAFLTRVAALPERSRRVLLIAAADEVGDVTVVGAAATQLGLDVSDFAAAEAVGLVQVGGSVRFRHPLVRSAVYRSSVRDERKAVHEALAAVVSEPTRRAWHRALVADRADEDIATELEAAALDAVARGAQVTAATAYERAAELSELPERRGHRLTEAAKATLDGGRPDAALALIERARPLATDPLDMVTLAMTRSSNAGRRGRNAESEVLLRDAAPLVAAIAPDKAAELLLWSVMTSLGSNRLEPAVARAVEGLAGIRDSGPSIAFVRSVLDGLTAMLGGHPADAREHLSKANELATSLTDITSRSLGLFIGTWNGDYAATRRGSEAVVAELRQQGALASLTGTLSLLAIGELGDGRIAAARRTATEGRELSERLGFTNDETAAMGLLVGVLAHDGKEQECRELASAVLRRSLASEMDWVTMWTRIALAQLELGLGNAREALHLLDQVDPAPVPAAATLAMPDRIDAALRLGEEDIAADALARLEAWAPLSDTRLVAGMVARSRALLAGDEAEPLFLEALEQQSRDTPVLERARTQLAYGEWLRRARRRLDARAQLRTALDTFEGLGAALWADRARAELQATGERARKRDASTLDDLTPQELRIAQLVAAGATNRDVGAQLFVSPKTVEYHLGKVFMKLGVSSRVELARTPLGEPGTD